jgi:hypothetical protein
MLSKKVGWRSGGRRSVVKANVSRILGSKVLGALGTVRPRVMLKGVGRLTEDIVSNDIIICGVAWLC